MARRICVLFAIRGQRRRCPALNEEICAVCCGTGREQTIDCPLECEYLRDARRHEKLPRSIQRPCQSGNRAVRPVHERAPAIDDRSRSVAAGGSGGNAGTVDLDLRDALEALVTTYKTADSGLIYESRPANAIAAQAADRFTHGLQQFREDVAKRSASHSIRDKDILGCWCSGREWNTSAVTAAAKAGPSPSRCTRSCRRHPIRPRAERHRHHGLIPRRDDMRARLIKSAKSARGASFRLRRPHLGALGFHARPIRFFLPGHSRRSVTRPIRSLPPGRQPLRAVPESRKGWHFLSVVI